MGQMKSDPPSNVQGGGTQAITEQARDVATQAAQEAKEVVSHRVDAQKAKSAERLSDVAEVFRHTSEELQDDILAPYVRRAADRIDRAAEYIREADVGEIVDNAEGYARREPALFLGGAFLLGVLGARFLRSSAMEPR